MSPTAADPKESRVGGARVLLPPLMHPRGRDWIPAAVVLMVLCGVLTFTALTVNRPYLSNVSTNRFWGVCQTWQIRGYFATFGLWLEYRDPAFYRQEGAPGVYAYANSDTGFLVPIYAAEQVVRAVKGRASPLLFQLYSQIVILIGAFFLALLGMKAAERRGHDRVLGVTLGLSAAVVYQNLINNLHRAQEIHHSTVFLTLMILLLYLRERWSDRVGRFERGPALAVGALMFWMAVSDHVVNAAFLALAFGLLAFYRVCRPLALKHWLVIYVLPVVLGAALFQLQLWLGRTQLGIASVGSPLLLRLGFGNTGFAHAQILTFLRPPWSWWGLAALAAACLAAVLAVRSRPGDEHDQRDLDAVLTPIVVWLCLAAVFSELVSIHPYIYDLFLMIPAVLLVFVHGPLLAARYYRHPGVIGLTVLLGALWYVWSSLATYSALAARLPIP